MKVLKGEDGFYKPCNEDQAKYCDKYDMLICTLCPHGIKIESEVKQ